MKQKITNFTSSIPYGATHLEVTGKLPSGVQVEYYRPDGTYISAVSPAGRLLSEETYKKITEDPRRKDQDKKKDLPYGRNLTVGDKALGYGAEPEVIDLTPQGPPKIEVFGKRKLYVGKVKGTDNNVFESVGDSTTYEWRAILEALTKAEISKEEIRSILMHLQGNEITIEEKKTLREADDAEIAKELSDNDLEEKEKISGVRRGMSLEEVENALMNVSSSELERIENLPRGTKIQIVKIESGKVTKIIPSKVLRTLYANGMTRATLNTANERVEIKITRDPDIIYLKKDKKTGVYYYLDQFNEEKEPKINYVGGR